MKKLITAIAILSLVSCASPISKFLIKSAETTAPAKVVFQNLSQNADRFEWQFGDSIVSADSSTLHIFNHSGNYTVTLKAFKGNKVNQSQQNVLIKAPLACLVQIETDYGIMVVELSNATPLHRDNFTKLAAEGFYDGTLFHRIITDFMIQGGDPDSKNAAAGQGLGSGGPGYTIPAEFVDSLIHVKGALAAARQSDAVNPKRASSGSQFYIVQGKTYTTDVLDKIEAQKNFRYSSAQRQAYINTGGTPFLDRDYTVFGHIISGLEVVDKIAAAQKDGRDRPVKDIKMKIRVIK